MKKEILEQELPPILIELKAKGDGLRVPDDYFDDLETAVFARLESTGALRRPVIKAEKRPSLFSVSIKPRAAMALAATLALVLAAVWFFRQDSVVVSQPSVASAELTEEDLESYLIDNVQEFDPEQLALLTPEEPTETTEENTPGTPKKNSRSSSEIRPDDLDKILDEMTDEELEQIL